MQRYTYQHLYILIFGVPSFFLTYRHFSHVAGTLPLRVRAGDCQMARGQCERHSGQLTELSFAWSGQCCIIMKVYSLHLFLSLAYWNIPAQEDAKENSIRLSLVVWAVLFAQHTSKVRTKKAASQTAYKYWIELSFTSSCTWMDTNLCKNARIGEFPYKHSLLCLKRM